MNTKKNEEGKYRLQVYNYLSNKSTTGEKKELFNWLQQSEENVKAFSEYKKVFDLTVGLNYKNNFSHRRSLNFDKLRSKIDPLSSSDQRMRKARKLRIFYQVAASILLAVTIGSFIYIHNQNNNIVQKLSDTEYQILVPMGSKSEVVLPDGTKVWLNAGSSFKYEADYGINVREVHLKGEGYFSVIKNPDKPFTVNTSGLKVKAYGTSFNVKAYPEEKYVTTTLVEGSVKIEGKGLNISLEPKEVVVINRNINEINKYKIESSSLEGKKADYNKSKINEDISVQKEVQVKTDVNIDIYTAWKDNYWILESESIGNIASILERKFDVTIQIESPELNQYTFTGTFHKETLEQILDILKLTAPLKYEIKKGIVVIKAEKNRKIIYDRFRE